MRIQNNIMAMNTHRQYSTNNSNIQKSAEKLSSGYRINRAGDDAAGLAISEKMRSQVRGLNMASKNSQDAISLIQTAEGALQEVHSMLQRMNELANQAATGTNQTFDREQINAEFNQLKSEIDDISAQTSFNNMNLLDGTLGGNDATVASTSKLKVNAAIGKYTVTGQSGLSDKVGAYTFAAGTNATTDVKVRFTDANGNVTNTNVDLTKAISGDTVKGGAFTLDLSSAGLGTYSMTAATDATFTATSVAELATAIIGANVTTEAGPSAGNGTLKIQVGANEGQQLEISVKKMDTDGLGVASSSIATQDDAGKAITATQGAINKVSEQRATLGAMQNRLEHKIANLDNTSENLSAAESRIRDIDIAKEMTSYTKNNILSQASTAMLAQANAAPQNVLSLLQ